MKYNALEFMKKFGQTTVDSRELNKDYFVAEWSWIPMVDGVFSHVERLKYAQEFIVPDEKYKWMTRKYIVYQTGTNNRWYFHWEVFDTKEDSETGCAFQDMWVYDYDMARYDMLNWLIKQTGLTLEDHSIDGTLFKEVGG